MSSTKSGIFLTGYHGSNILTAIYSVLSVPPLTTAAATAPSEPLQWLTLGIQWLPDGPWHLKQKNIEWWMCFGNFQLYSLHMGWIFVGRMPIHEHVGMTSLSLWVYPCIISLGNSMLKTTRVWTSGDVSKEEGHGLWRLRGTCRWSTRCHCTQDAAHGTWNCMLDSGGTSSWVHSGEAAVWWAAGQEIVDQGLHFWTQRMPKF